jgi:hypothetical protein
MLEIPNKEIVVKDLSSSFPIMHAALDYGTHKVRDFFDKEERIIDRYLAPNLVRYYALDYFTNHGLERIVLGNIPNNGLYLSTEAYNIRILKSKPDKIPVPGHSLSRQQYYEQANFFFVEASETNNKLNLLLLWDVIGHYQLNKLSLACPRSGGTTRASVSAHWHCSIPQEYYFKQSDEKIDMANITIEDLPLNFKIDEITNEGFK